MTGSLFDVDPAIDPDVTHGICPVCGCKTARVRLRPDTVHHAELRCPDCHHFRWLKKDRDEPERTDEMATATTAAPAANDVWSIEVKNGSGGGDYVCCPPGNHPGTIVGLFDVGHQDGTDMKGQPIQQRKLVLVFELTKKRPDGKPFVLAREYTWSMGEKANFYKDVVNITGVNFKEGDKFNPLTLAGQPVMVSVKNTGNGEKTYHNVSAVAQFPEGFPAPDATIHPVSWSVMTGEPFPADSDWLPFVYGQSIAEKADQSKEARSRKAPQPVAAAGTPGSDDSDIPF